MTGCNRGHGQLVKNTRQQTSLTYIIIWAKFNLIYKFTGACTMPLHFLVLKQQNNGYCNDRFTQMGFISAKITINS